MNALAVRPSTIRIMDQLFEYPIWDSMEPKLFQHFANPRLLGVSCGTFQSLKSLLISVTVHAPISEGGTHQDEDDLWKRSQVCDDF